MFDQIDPADDCAHDGRLGLVWEGWENPTEPLQIVVTCQRCHHGLRVVIEDASIREWTKDP